MVCNQTHRKENKYKTKITRTNRNDVSKKVQEPYPPQPLNSAIPTIKTRLYFVLLLVILNAKFEGLNIATVFSI